MVDDKLAKDTDFSNQSTWMVFVDMPELEARLLPCTGLLSVPIDMKVSSFGTDIELKRYTNSTIKELIDQVSELSGLEVSKLKLRVVEETQSRRIDTQLYQKETMTLPVEHRIHNTLHDVKIGNNSVFIVEEKTDEEIAG